LDPVYTGQTMLGLIYQELGAPEQGIRVLEELVRQEPSNTGWLLSPYGVLAYLYAQTGDRERARAALDRAESIFQPGMDVFASFFIGLARIHWFLLNDQPGQALEQAQKDLELYERFN